MPSFRRQLGNLLRIADRSMPTIIIKGYQFVGGGNVKAPSIIGLESQPMRFIEASHYCYIFLRFPITVFIRQSHHLAGLS